MLFQTQTFQRTNIFQWISMNVGTFPIAPIAISNFQSTHIFYRVITPIDWKNFFVVKEKIRKLWNKWWQIFSILWVPWINGVLSKPLPIPREIYFPQNIVDLTLFGDAGNKVTKVSQLYLAKYLDCKLSWQNSSVKWHPRDWKWRSLSGNRRRGGAGVVESLSCKRFLSSGGSEPVCPQKGAVCNSLHKWSRKGKICRSQHPPSFFWRRRKTKYFIQCKTDKWNWVEGTNFLKTSLYKNSLRWDVKCKPVRHSRVSQGVGRLYPPDPC